jgi:hypothetical protein
LALKALAKALTKALGQGRMIARSASTSCGTMSDWGGLRALWGLIWKRSRDDIPAHRRDRDTNVFIGGCLGSLGMSRMDSVQRWAI